MGRDRDPATTPMYDLHQRWLSDVLPRGDSLFTPGERVWTTENLDELVRDFVSNPDLTPGKSYLDKLRDQLAQSSDAARQLMAELHVIHFLAIATSAISASKKLADLRAIVSWMQAPVDIPDDVAQAMSPGLVHPGQWALTRRDTQITWLIELSRAAKARTAGLPEDPWELRAFAQSVVTPSSGAARLAFLHLARPDTFEPCVSVEHKAMMVQRFRQLTGIADDVDRQLVDIRRALSAEYGEGFSFYDEPMFRRWYRGKAWKEFMAWLERFRAEPRFDEWERDYKLLLAGLLDSARQKLMAGDHAWTRDLESAIKHSDNNLTGWRINQPFLQWVNENQATADGALRLLWSQEGAASARLEKFLAAVPPDVLQQPGQRLNMGTFLLMGTDATTYPPAKITPFWTAWRLTGFGEESPSASIAEIYDRILLFLDELQHDARDWKAPLRDRLDAQGAVWLLTKWDVAKFGLPTSWSDDDWRKFDLWRATEPESDEVDGPADGGDDGVEPPVDYIAEAAKDLCLDRSVLDEIVQLLDDKRQVVLYGPPGTGKTYLALRLARAIAETDDSRVSIVQFHPATTYEDFFEGLRPTLTDAGEVIYQRTDGPLVDLADRATADPDRAYVMVIDEINRANLPKVFGELLFLLEYRDESARTLYRPTAPFKLPKNLRFIGTMNTADRSVALIDAAMRRRFHFVPFFPHEGAMKPLLRAWLTVHGLPSRIADFLDAVNDELLGRLGDHLLIGPSHFMKSDLSEPALEAIWTYNVYPLLEELLWGQRDEIQQWRWPEVRKRFAVQLTGRAEVPAEESTDNDTADDAGASNGDDD